MKKILSFLKGVKKEMTRVRWPNKKEMAKFSVATISIMLFFMAFFTISALVVSLLIGLV